MKQVMIDETLFGDLLEYHILNNRTNELENKIEKQLKEKFAKIQRRIDYGKNLKKE